MLSWLEVHPVALGESPPCSAAVVPAGGRTASRATSALVPSSNSSAISPRVAPGDKREKSGWTFNAVALPETTLELLGVYENQRPTPGVVTGPEPNVVG